MTEKTTDQYAAEFGDALGLDGETLESVLPAAATRAPAVERRFSPRARTRATTRSRSSRRST